MFRGVTFDARRGCVNQITKKQLYCALIDSLIFTETDLMTPLEQRRISTHTTKNNKKASYRKWIAGPQVQLFSKIMFYS